MLERRHHVCALKLFHSADFSRRLAQTVPAQAIIIPDRHRQARGFLGAPARACEAAGEFRSAAGTGEAAGARYF
jgi:hypothetical protein